MAQGNGLVHRVSTFEGVPLQRVGATQQKKSPFNPVVYLEQWGKNNTAVEGCSGTIAGYPRILVVAAHCVPEVKGPGGSLEFKYPIGIKSDARGSTYSGYQEITAADLCMKSKPHLHPTMADDFKVFYLPKAFPGVTPLRVLPASQLPKNCENNLANIGYMLELDRHPHLFYTTKPCQRESGSEGFDALVRPDARGTISHNCSDTEGASGSPLICTEPVHGHLEHVLYSISIGGVLHNRHSWLDIPYEQGRSNFAISPAKISSAVIWCMKKKGLMPTQRPSHSGSVASFKYTSY